MTPWEDYFDSLTEDELLHGAKCPACGETVAMHAYRELEHCADRFNAARFAPPAREDDERAKDRAMRFGLSGIHEDG